MKKKGKYLQKKPRKTFPWFTLCFCIYLILMAAAISYGLLLLWNRMDVYERSRPHQAMESMMASTTPEGWHDLLSSYGISDHYIETLDLQDAVYYKDINRYTESAPAYGIRFGSTRMLYITLQPGETLDFGSFAWAIKSIEPVKSGLCIYAPADATITVEGKPIGKEYMTEEDALPLTVGPFEEGRVEIPGLAKFRLDHVYDNSGIAVTDAQGRPLELSHETGKSSYYPPLMENYTVTAPSDATVSVNGIALPESDALDYVANEDFKDLDEYIPYMPGTVRYEVNDLLLRPEITAVTSDGTVLNVTEEGNHFTFAREHNEALAAEQEAYILEAFDAYIAFSGNRDGVLRTNYSRYMSYLVPESEPAQRAVGALESLSWMSNRDESLKSCEVSEVISYSDDLFTAQIDFTMKSDTTENANSYLFFFLRTAEEEWKVFRILNKTSFLAG
ncbi:MAG: hypothetical protein IJP11_01650 [Oscillospiraceae bacterium]|nr:hypothetical protein [Oscillospiraceae bacterium]